jgi:hypothetical protein
MEHTSFSSAGPSIEGFTFGIIYLNNAEFDNLPSIILIS